MKALIDQKITDITGAPWKVPEMDEDGELVMGGDGEPNMVPSDTRSAIRIVMLNVPQSKQKKNDSLRAAQMFNQLDKQSDNGHIEIKDKTYDWFHKLLLREIPVTKEAKERGVLERTYAMHLWGMATAHITNQLTELETRKETLDDDDDDE